MKWVDIENECRNAQLHFGIVHIHHLNWLRNWPTLFIENSVHKNILQLFFFFFLILDFSGLNPIFYIGKMIAVHITTVTALQNWHLRISGKIVKTLINFKWTYIFHFYKLNCRSFEVHSQISFKFIYLLLSFYI